jgi:hypothetical protein
MRVFSFSYADVPCRPEERLHVYPDEAPPPSGDFAAGQRAPVHHWCACRATRWTEGNEQATLLGSAIMRSA